MNAFYRSVQRAIVLVLAAIVMTVATGAAIWSGLNFVGIRLSAYAVIGGLGVVIVWLALSSPSGRRSPPKPPPPRPRPRSHAEIEALLILCRKGVIRAPSSRPPSVT